MTDPTTPPPPPARPAALHPLALLGLSAAALLLRCHALDRQSIWYDEANGIRIAVRAIPELFSELTADASPPLYYLILHAWTALLGQHEFAVRALSALAGAATIPLIAITARRLFSTRAAWTAAILAALSPFHLYYSQEARMYAILAGLATLLLYLGDRAARHDRRRDWAGFAITAALAAYTHHYGLFATAGVAAALALRLHRRPAALRHLAFALAAAALLYLPWLPFAIRSQLQGSAITGGWLPPFSPQLLTQTLSHLCSLHMLTFRSPVFWLGSAGVAMAVAGLILRRLRGPNGLPPRWRCRLTPGAAYVATALIVGIAIPIAISAVRPIYLPERYAIAFFPAAVILLAAGLDRLPTAWYRTGTAALALAAAVGILWHFAYMRKSDDRHAAIFLAETIRDHDLVVFTPHWTAVAPLYYLKELPRQTGYPMRTLEERQHRNEALERERRTLPDMIASLEQHRQLPQARLILVRLMAAWEADAEPLQQAIEQSWTPTARRAFPPLSITVYERPPTHTPETP